MTLDDMKTIAAFAITLALQAPKNRNRWAVSATVLWDTIEGLRAAMEDAGIDWRELWDNAHKAKVGGGDE